MSRAAPIPDAERTATMLDLLHRRCIGTELVGAPARVLLEEVAPGTGWSAAQRWADVLILDMWPSRGLSLHGYEIKASRADLKRELADLTKHQAVARYCDSWTLVAWDDAVLVDGLPDDWGLITTRDGEHGRELVDVRKPTKREPAEWPRSFVCSMVRNAYQQSPGAAYVARACLEAEAKGRRAGRDLERDALRHAMRPLCELLFGTNSWNWPAAAREPEAVMKLAAERLQQGALSLGTAS